MAVWPDCCKYICFVESNCVDSLHWLDSARQFERVKTGKGDRVQLGMELLKLMKAYIIYSSHCHI